MNGGKADIVAHLARVLRGILNDLVWSALSALDTVATRTYHATEAAGVWLANVSGWTVEVRMNWYFAREHLSIAALPVAEAFVKNEPYCPFGHDRHDAAILGCTRLYCAFDREYQYNESLQRLSSHEHEYDLLHSPDINVPVNADDDDYAERLARYVGSPR